MDAFIPGGTGLAAGRCPGAGGFAVTAGLAAARAAGEYRIYRLGRGHVVVRLERLGYPVALDIELLEELDALARRRIPTTHILYLDTA